MTHASEDPSADGSGVGPSPSRALDAIERASRAAARGTPDVGRTNEQDGYDDLVDLARGAAAARESAARTRAVLDEWGRFARDVWADELATRYCEETGLSPDDAIDWAWIENPDVGAPAHRMTNAAREDATRARAVATAAQLCVGEFVARVDTDGAGARLPTGARSAWPAWLTDADVESCRASVADWIARGAPLPLLPTYPGAADGALDACRPLRNAVDALMNARRSVALLGVDARASRLRELRGTEHGVSRPSPREWLRACADTGPITWPAFVAALHALAEHHVAAEWRPFDRWPQELAALLGQPIRLENQRDGVASGALLPAPGAIETLAAWPRERLNAWRAELDSASACLLIAAYGLLNDAQRAGTATRYGDGAMSLTVRLRELFKRAGYDDDGGALRRKVFGALVALEVRRFPVTRVVRRPDGGHTLHARTTPIIELTVHFEATEGGRHGLSAAEARRLEEEWQRTGGHGWTDRLPDSVTLRFSALAADLTNGQQLPRDLCVRLRRAAQVVGDRRGVRDLDVKLYLWLRHSEQRDGRAYLDIEAFARSYYGDTQVEAYVKRRAFAAKCRAPIMQSARVLEAAGLYALVTDRYRTARNEARAIFRPLDSRHTSPTRTTNARARDGARGDDRRKRAA